MKIITWLKSILKKDSGARVYQYTIELEMVKNSLDYGLFNDLNHQISEKIAQDIYLEIKDKLLKDKGIDKIINMVRLSIVKEFKENK